MRNTRKLCKTMSNRSCKLIESPLSWDEKNLAIAKLLASFSKDPSRKCGAYICTLSNIPVSHGFNGLPQGLPDLASVLNNRELKLQQILHAEENALAFSPTNDLSNCKIYTWPFRPCAKCASQLLQRRIHTVVAPRPIPIKWESSCNLATKNFKKAGVKVILL